MTLQEIYDNSTDELEIKLEDLSSIWTNSFKDEEETFSFYENKREFIQSFEYSIHHEQGTDLHFISGGWVISIKVELLKALISAALLGAAMYSTGEKNISAAIIAAILPNIFDLKRVKLDIQEQHILTRLHKKSGSDDQFRSIEEWYRKIPKKIRQDIEKKDFQEFLIKLVQVRAAKKDKKGRIAITDSKQKFKISFD